MDPLDKVSQDSVFVVVPSYNHAPFVQRCLRSIIGQTHRPEKLLVIDDGSWDGSPAIIEKVLNDAPFATELIARENRGLCATLNQALDLSKGEFFAYLGSDDVWLPPFLKEQTNLLAKRPNAVLAFSHAYLVDENDSVFDSTAEWTDFADGDLRPLLLAGSVFSSPGVLYRRDALKRHRWNETARLEDYEMYLKLSYDGEFARNQKVLCAWRQHGENASGDLPLMVDEMVAAQNRILPAAERDRYQSVLRFAAAENLVRHGFRYEAAKLFIENLDGARSWSDVARTAARLTVPQTLFQWNRRRKRRAAESKYGTLDEVMKNG
ncbi:MAG TPA: glycosyltransferase family A protein [Pyrinomonadaceae bacterium]|nr:glycosyltransferase family A protein [Pyrinomonadaceae bacterium]